ncbi:MAG: HDIG domain-containing protein [bacterium]|nr:HDIG domain-containing protein [bacterium]
MIKSGMEEKKKVTPLQPPKKDASAQKDNAPIGLNLVEFLAQRAIWQKRMLLLVVSLLAALIISPRITSLTYNYVVGDIARKNIKAPRDFLVEDAASTAVKREEASLTSLTVYDFDDGTSKDVQGRLSRTFSLMRQYLAEIEKNVLNASSDSGKQDMAMNSNQKSRELRSAFLLASREERLQAFERELLVKLDINDFVSLESNGFLFEDEQLLLKALLPLLDRGIVGSKELILQETGKGVVIRRLRSQKEQVVQEVSKFMALDEARKEGTKKLLSLMEGRKKSEKNATSNLLNLLIKPNLSLNRDETEKRKAIAVEAVNPVFFQVKEGEMILREGERVDKNHLSKLDALTGKKEGKANYLNALGIFFLIALLIYSFYYFSSKNIRKAALLPKDQLFLGVIFLFTLFVFSFALPVATALSNAFPVIPSHAYQYLFTAAAGVILIRVVLNSEVAIIFSMIISLMAAIIMNNSLFFAAYSLVGCIAGAQAVRYCKYRVTLIKAGFYVGMTNCLMVLIFMIMSGNITEVDLLGFSLLFAFLGGVISGVVVTGLTPIVEGVFSYTTNFKLLELASLDHPLLKELITQSPGTYHHSWIIGNLVETAAESINANSLLARVSALYHDIGKMKKPQYFFENQKGGKNPHDKLAPSLSALILIGHVKDGMELAREYNLGKEITDIIPQHHGTRLIRFFYQKAKDQEDPDVHSVNEKDFRYPGPKPQTKEAGLVMLADAVEAVSRTIQDPTPARIQAVVKKIIGEIFVDGQLDECELTLKDLNQIANSFNRILNGIFHARIDYPDLDKNDKNGEKANEGSHRGNKELEGGKEAGDKQSGKKGSPPLEFGWC